MEEAAFLDLAVEMVRRSDVRGLPVPPRRWIVERPFGWMIYRAGSSATTSVGSTCPRP
jgi:hypothetical protein